MKNENSIIEVTVSETQLESMESNANKKEMLLTGFVNNALISWGNDHSTLPIHEEKQLCKVNVRVSPEAKEAYLKLMEQFLVELGLIECLRFKED